jgi:hypothetical protein
MVRKYPQVLLEWIPGPADLSSFRVSQTASRKFEAVITGEVNLEAQGSSVSSAIHNLIKQIKDQVGEERYLEIFKERFERYQEALMVIGRWTLGQRNKKPSESDSPLFL